MFIVTSDFAATPIVPANSHGPYLVVGGGPVLLSAGVAHPGATYHWELGDGSVAATPDVVHRYGKSGVYVAKLTVTVNEPGGAVTRHFATIQIENVPPQVDAGAARTVNEGDVTSFTANFVDPEWLDTHTASWDWGDPGPRTPGAVTETHLEPQGRGTVEAGHAWGDAGDYMVVLSVRDDAGGVGQATVPVTVLNVPPTVEAGPPLYAYPCSVLTLRGSFTDPGWLDRHAGFWDFGDGSGLQTAVVRETNLPPRGTGLAIASHSYERCGNYVARCTVIDDDGAPGSDATEIRVVDIVNRNFEDGFHGDPLGAVANGWIAYTGSESVGPPLKGINYVAPNSPRLFSGENILVHGGPRAQRIRFDGTGRAGIFQRVGANLDWDYQIGVWYSLHPQAGGDSQLIVDPNEVPPDPLGAGVARLGIDPRGGTDPSAPWIQWSEGRMRGEWGQLAVRAAAAASAITIFLEGIGDDRLQTDVAFDDAALAAIQPYCLEPEKQKPEPQKPEPQKPEKRCVDFRDAKRGELPPTFTKDGFSFTASDKQAQLIVAWGDPPATPKLQLRTAEIITLPFVADHVEITIFAKGSVTRVVARDAAGQRLVESATDPSQSLQTLTLDALGIVDVVLTSRGRETLIVQVCASRSSTPPARALAAEGPHAR